MAFSKKFTSGLVGAILFAGIVVVGGPGTASAAATATASGTVTCARTNGLIRFSPSVTLVGGPVDVSIEVVFHDCAPSAGSNVSTPSFKGKALGTATVQGGTNCSSLVGGSPAFDVVGSLTVTWTGRVQRKFRMAPSVITLGQMTSVAAGKNGDIGFVVSRQTLSGSFAGTSSTASGELDSNKAWTRIVCGASHAVSKLHVVAGSLSQP